MAPRKVSTRWARRATTARYRRRKPERTETKNVRPPVVKWTVFAVWRVSKLTTTTRPYVKALDESRVVFGLIFSPAISNGKRPEIRLIFLHGCPANGVISRVSVFPLVQSPFWHLYRAIVRVIVSSSPRVRTIHIIYVLDIVSDARLNCRRFRTTGRARAFRFEIDSER